METRDEKIKRKMLNISWISSSVIFNFFLIYGLYIAKVIHTANGGVPPWEAAAAFDFVVVVLLRLALRSKYELSKEKVSTQPPDKKAGGSK